MMLPVLVRHPPGSRRQCWRTEDRQFMVRREQKGRRGRSIVRIYTRTGRPPGNGPQWKQIAACADVGAAAVLIDKWLTAEAKKVLLGTSAPSKEWSSYEIHT